eukprot:scaffold365711_cov19-Prasinocladus_malaysianus.AAC.2
MDTCGLVVSKRRSALRACVHLSHTIVFAGPLSATGCGSSHPLSLDNLSAVAGPNRQTSSAVENPSRPAT